MGIFSSEVVRAASNLLFSRYHQRKTKTAKMPNLKLIAMRLKSVKNIQKITQSMKMVSAAKFAKAERDLKSARPLGIAAQQFYKSAEMTTDRGLAGAVHSNVNKAIRAKLEAKLAAGESLDNVKILCVGDKSRAFFQRFFPKQVVMVGSEIGRLPPTFNDAAKIANAILTSGYEFDKGSLLFNYYKNVASNETTEMPIYSQDVVSASEKVTVYDSLDADVVQSYMEYSLASLVYYCLKEGATSEQASRMSAMDNSSKNAGEMIDKLTITFNRTRQAVITGELIEIISGAAAL